MKYLKRLLLAAALLAVSAGTTQAELKDDLVSYWPLDEIQGSKTPDLVSRYDMDVLNLTSDDIVEGRFGSAFNFDNVRQTILTRVHADGENLPVNQHASYTISMWVKIAGAGQNDLRIFSEGSTTDNNPLFNIGTHNGGADGTVDLFIRNGPGGWPTVGHIYTTNEAFDDQWRHVVYVENEGMRAFYIDGVLDALEIAERPEGDFPVNNTSIGGIQRSVQSHWVTGLIDDVAIWKRALTDDEITEVAANGLQSVFPPITRGLVSHWPLDEIQGTKTPDLVSGYDMDVVNLVAEDVVAGKNGNAFSFDNARNTILTRVHNPGEKLPANQYSSFTISMWVNVAGAGQNDLRVFSEGSTVDNNPLFNIGTHNGGADGTVDLFIRNGPGGWPTVGHIYTTAEAFDSEWRHLVYVENEGMRAFYIDGVLDALEIAPRPEEGDFPVNNTSIGGIQRSVQSHWVTGLIDDVAIWSRALTEDEIASVRDNGVPETISPPPAPLEIRSFQAEYTSVASGGNVLLSWDVNPDAQIDIQPGIGNVNANTTFGVGSVEAAVTGDTTFVITISRGDDSVSAEYSVKARAGVGEGWALLEDFEGLTAGQINGQARWLNAEGRADVIDLGGNKVFSPMGNGALSNIKLGSYEVDEGDEVTLFFRAYLADAFSPIGVNVGLTEKTLRFNGDAGGNVGPHVRVNKLEGFLPAELQARNGVGGNFETFFDLELQSGIVYNVWVNIMNDTIENGDLYSVFIAEEGGTPQLAFEDYIGDRNPAGSQDLGAVKPNLTDLFIVSNGGQTGGGALLLDDFYLSPAGFSDTVPVPASSFEATSTGGGDIGELIITNGSFDSANSTVSLTFTSVVGATYSVVARSALGDGEWTEVLAGIAGQANETTVQVTGASADQSFYIIRGSAPAGPSAIFFDDLENGKGEWMTGAYNGDDLWELGTPTKADLDGAFSGDNVFATNLDGDYTISTQAYLKTPVIDLTGVSSATLSFQTSFETEQGLDFLRINITDENGEYILGNDGFDIPALREIISLDGSSGDGWKKINKALPAEAMGRQIRIEFLLDSDSFENAAGWYIDDVTVR